MGSGQLGAKFFNWVGSGQFVAKVIKRRMFGLVWKQVFSSADSGQFGARVLKWVSSEQFGIEAPNRGVSDLLQANLLN